MPRYDNIENLINNPSHIAGKQQNPIQSEIPDSYIHRAS